MTKVLVVHDELLHVLVVDVHHGVKHVPEVTASTCNRFLFKNYSELIYHMALKKVLVVHDELLHVLVVDVHQGVEHVPEVPESNCNRFLLKKYAEMMYHTAYYWF